VATRTVVGNWASCAINGIMHMVDSVASGIRCALDLGERAVGRVHRRDRLGRTEHHAHQRVLVADVDFLAVDAGRHRDQVAFAEHRLPALAVLLADDLHLAAHDEEDLFHVVVDVRGPTWPAGITMVENVKCAAGTVLLSLATPVPPVPM
jgi:hypothetical protein